LQENTFSKLDIEFFRQYFDTVGWHPPSKNIFSEKNKKCLPVGYLACLGVFPQNCRLLVN